MRVLLALVRVGVVLIAISAIFLLVYSVNAAIGMNARAQTKGVMSGAGVQAPVEIVRDNRGIPHIRAKNEHDMFFAQGTRKHRIARSKWICCAALSTANLRKCWAVPH